MSRSLNCPTTQLATTQSGFDFLEKSGVVDELADVLRGEDSSDVTATLVKCAALKFFGSLSGVQVGCFLRLSRP